MLDLIDRNAMLKTLENSGVLSEFARFLIKKQLAVDAVEVVRCKDCKHYHNRPNGLCYLHTEPCDNAKGYKGVAVCVEDNSFCNYGERTDNNAKIP